MVEERIVLEGGKYTVVNNLGAIKVLRHGEEWRDCTGDKLIGAMFNEIQELKEQLRGGAPLEEKPVSCHNIKVGSKYNWKNQAERLVYLGLCLPHNGRWHQFALTDKPEVVWCEVRDSDLSSFEVSHEPG